MQDELGKELALLLTFHPPYISSWEVDHDP
jgi:hypothetical protein